MKLPARYTIVQSGLGGGMSSVSLAKDTQLDRDVIIKELSPTVDKQRLLDEIRALQTIRSAYVVQIYDVIADDDGEIEGIVEEYCEGADLSEEIGKVSQQDFVKFGYQLSCGLSEVHSCGVIHRDIKPQNIRIGPINRLTIIDFGLARKSGSDAVTTSHIGTTGFMAPELFVPNASGQVEFTNKIDIFALASSLLLLSDGALPKALMKRPPSMPPGVDFRAIKTSMPDDLADVLNRCLETNPNNRPAADEVSAAFRRVLLRDKHRSLINLGNNPQYLDNTNPKVTASIQGIASLVIEYDGDRFVATSVTGSVYINNMAVTPGFVLPGSCVIGFGAPELQAGRVFVTFDVSHPGVEL